MEVLYQPISKRFIHRSHQQVYNLGETFTNVDDIAYYVNGGSGKVSVDSSLPLEERSFRWLKQVAAFLNLPHRYVFEAARDRDHFASDKFKEEDQRVGNADVYYDTTAAYLQGGYVGRPYNRWG